jgi:hypothetical protein
VSRKRYPFAVKVSGEERKGKAIKIRFAARQAHMLWKAGNVTII